MGGKPKKLIVPVIQRIGVDIMPVQGFVPKIILDYVRHSNRLYQITVPDIEAYRLGLCCLASRAFEPKISALMELTSG